MPKTTAAPELIDPAAVATPEPGTRMQLASAVDDVEALCARLVERGVKLLNGPIDRRWAIRLVSFRDPGDHISEIAK